jgi:lincosamide nucleotidyltransferase
VGDRLVSVAEVCVVVDKDGELSRRVSTVVRRPPDLDTSERAIFLYRSLMKWTLMGANLLKRGEYARAEAFLTLLHAHLLRAVRLAEGKSANWFSPSRGLEEEVSAASYERFRACTAALDAEQLVRAYASTWEWSRELIGVLATRHAFTLPEALLNKLNEHVGVG